jgi:hypothetical protein
VVSMLASGTLGGLVASMLASGSQDRGFAPGRVKMETAVFEEGKRKCRELPHSHGLGHGLVNVSHNYDTIPNKMKVSV